MTSASPWIASLGPRARPQCRLICLPYAGGSASSYRQWPALFPEEIEVSAIELPGHGMRMGEPPRTRLEELVSELAGVLPLLFDRPYALFGHSLGAALAFELARRLQSSPAPGPRWLFVSGRRAPHLPPRRAPVHALPDDAFLSELRRFEGTPDAVLENDELLSLFLPILRADFALLETHAFVDGDPVTCGMTVLGGTEDPEVEVDSLQAWQRHASADFQVRRYPGNHFFPWSCPEQLAADVARDVIAGCDG